MSSCKLSCTILQTLVERGSYIFQDDMLLSEKQLEAALQGGDLDMPKDPEHKIGVPQSSKSAVGAFVLKWDNAVVPYVIDGSASKVLIIVV